MISTKYKNYITFQYKIQQQQKKEYQNKEKVRNTHDCFCSKIKQESLGIFYLIFSRLKFRTKLDSKQNNKNTASLNNKAYINTKLNTNLFYLSQNFFLFLFKASFQTEQNKQLLNSFYK